MSNHGDGMMSDQRNFGLDAVRAVAIGLVLVGHFLYGPYAEFAETPAFAGDFGGFGVELFFVLSGYLVGRIMQRTFGEPFGLRHVWNFYLRRWMRTFPVYYLFLGVEAWWAAPSLQGAMGVVAANPLYLIFSQNLAWPMGGWYGVTWSLAVEEWFYVLFPIAFMMLSAVGVKHRVLAATLGSIVLCLLLRIVIYTPGIDWDGGIRKVVVLRIDAIAFGVACALLTERFRPVVQRGRWWLAALGVVGVVGVLESRSFIDTLGVAFFFTGYFTVVPLTLVFFLPVAERMDWSRCTVAPARRSVVWLSTHAYVLYLSHFLILAMMAYYKPYGSLWSAVAVYVGACAAVAAVVHRLVEKPVMDLRPAEIRVIGDAVRAGGLVGGGASGKRGATADRIA